MVAAVRNDIAEEIDRLVANLLDGSPPQVVGDRAFWAAQFDAGLAKVDAPVGAGGLGVPRRHQQQVDAALEEAGAPRNESVNLIGVQMLPPVLLEHGTDEQRREHLRAAFACEQIWCQLFSEPEAGSDLASLRTRAVPDGDGWRVTGQKVWTTCAHIADKALLLARTEDGESRHRGLSYFLLDMRSPGVEVRPLRQITGEAEYNEVFLTDVELPSEALVGERGQGWSIAMRTLASERAASADLNTATQQMVASAIATWRSLPAERRSVTLRDELAQVCTDAKVFELIALGVVGEVGHGPMVKLQYAALWQRLTDLCTRMRGLDGLLGLDYEMTRPDRFTSTYVVDLAGDELPKALLASQALSIAGGTTHINKNVLAERVLGLPR